MEDEKHNIQGGYVEEDTYEAPLTPTNMQPYHMQGQQPELHTSDAVGYDTAGSINLPHSIQKQPTVRSSVDQLEDEDNVMLRADNEESPRSGNDPK